MQTLRYQTRQFQQLRGRLRKLTVLNPPLVFLHVPKCGGTAVEKAIRRCSIRRAARLDVEALRHAVRLPCHDSIPGGMTLTSKDCFPHAVAIVAYHLFRGDGYVHGHFPVSRSILDRFGSTHQFMTVLRDPIERWISNYRFDKVRNTRSDRLPWRDNPQPIEDEMRAVMRSPRGVELARIYTWMLGGIEANGDIGSAAAVDLAKENLERFQIRCTVDDWMPLIRRVRELYAWRLVMNDRNVTDNKERNAGVQYNIKAALGDGLRRELVTLCAQDIEIFHYCKQLSKGAL